MRHVPARALVPALAIAATAAAAVGTAAARTHQHTATAATIAVSATDFRFKLTPAAGPRAGQTVTFAVKNNGKVNHDFKIAGKKTKVLRPGQTTRLAVKFIKAGKYLYICTVDAHRQLGMKGTYTVRPAQ
jgi:uncharacterized cupredoxin-like copper-binding protein